MALSDPLDILLAHDHWATRQILETCARLTDQQFHRRFEMGPGSLHDTTAHIISCMRGWTAVLNERESGSSPLGATRRTPHELLVLLANIADGFDLAAAALPNDGIVTTVFSGKSYAFTRGAVLTHVLTHSMHHRAQCLNMLRHLGVDPLPHSAVDDWAITVDPVST